MLEREGTKCPSPCPQNGGPSLFSLYKKDLIVNTNSACILRNTWSTLETCVEIDQRDRSCESVAECVARREDTSKLESLPYPHGYVSQ